MISIDKFSFKYIGILISLVMLIFIFRIQLPITKSGILLILLMYFFFQLCRFQILIGKILTVKYTHILIIHMEIFVLLFI